MSNAPCFYVTVEAPAGASEESREALGQVLSRVAGKFSFAGMKDWSVDLGKGIRVLAVEREFHDLSWHRGRTPYEVFFYKQADAKIYAELIRRSIAGLKVSKPKRQAQKDWMKLWRRHYKPVSVARGGLWIYPAWQKVPAARKGKCVKIWPGQAFGTGTHQTTMFCLEILVEEARKKPEILDSVFDFGAGTGILALGALKLARASGRNSKAVAVEIDPAACVQLQKNASINRERLPVRRSWGSKKRYSLVFANVLAPVLLEFRARLLSAVKPGGVLILSGLLAEEAKGFLREFLRGTPGRFEGRILQKNGWAAVVIRC